MKKIALIVLSICFMQTAYTMDDSSDDIEMASNIIPANKTTASTTGAAHEPVIPHADLECQHAAAPANSQAQAPLLAQPQNPQPQSVHVHATAYLNSAEFAGKVDLLAKTIKERPRGLDGAWAWAGSTCIGITLYYLFNGGVNPTCNCTCNAPVVICPSSTTRPTPLAMDNGTMYNDTQANMTTDDIQSTIPLSTSGFMDTFSTLFNASSDNDTMPTTVPAKLKRD